MIVKFDFEVDSRFNYTFDPEQVYLFINTARETIEGFLKSLETEIDAYGGLVVVTVSHHIGVLKNMSIHPRFDYNDHFPDFLMNKIKENMTYTQFLNGLPAFLSDVY